MYELVSEWRDTDGKSGLRVIELGNALRVPRVALEELIGGPVHVPPQPAVDPTPDAAAPALPVAASSYASEPAPTSRQRPSRRPGTVTVTQLDLFAPLAAS